MLTIRLGIILALVTIIGSGIYYVLDLRANIAIAEENARQYEESISNQQELISQQHRDIEQIKMVNSQLSQSVQNKQREIDYLNEKFNVSANGQSRDLGAITRAKPGLVEKIVNRATNNVNRCFELATGAELKEGETNDECKELIDSINSQP